MGLRWEPDDLLYRQKLPPSFSKNFVSFFSNQKKSKKYGARHEPKSWDAESWWWASDWPIKSQKRICSFKPLWFKRQQLSIVRSSLPMYRCLSIDNIHWILLSFIEFQFETQIAKFGRIAYRLSVREIMESHWTQEQFASGSCLVPSCLAESQNFELKTFELKVAGLETKSLTRKKSN